MLDCNEYYYYHRTFSCTCLHTILGVNNPTVSLIHLDAITILHTKGKIRLFMVFVMNIRSTSGHALLIIHNINVNH